MKTNTHIKFSAMELLKLLPDAFTRLNSDQQELSLAIYRNLEKGRPVSIDDLVDTTSLEEGTIKEILSEWPGVYYDDQQKIIGYWGLAIHETSHKLEVENDTLYAWCAWDTLFIPELLGKAAVIRSSDHFTKEEIVIEIDRFGNLINRRKDIYVSMLSMESIQEDVITTFCHFIYFFNNKEAGEAWVSKHNGTFLISLDEAIELSQTKNRMQYKDFFIE